MTVLTNPFFLIRNSMIIEPNIKNSGNILLGAAEYIDKKLYLEVKPKPLSEIKFDCKYNQIQSLFVKNKIIYNDIKNENKLVKEMINDLVLDYNIETLAILRKRESTSQIIALHNCELIDFCDLFFEISDSINKTISNKKFDIHITQYQLKLENRKIMIAEKIGEDYLIALLIDSSKISTGVILNVFIPLLKEELFKILIDS